MCAFLKFTEKVECTSKMLAQLYSLSNNFKLQLCFTQNGNVSPKTEQTIKKIPKINQANTPALELPTAIGPAATKPPPPR